MYRYIPPAAFSHWWVFLEGLFYPANWTNSRGHRFNLLLRGGSGRIVLTEPNTGLFSLGGAAVPVPVIGALITGAEMLAILSVFFSSPGVLLLLKKLNRPV